MKTIILFGLQRSGNHFLTSIILQQYNNWVHINNSFLSFSKYQKYKKMPKKRRRNMLHEYIGFEGVECIVISIENKYIDFKAVKKFKKNVKDCHFILLLRSPYDQICSLWKMKNYDNKVIKKMKEKWKYYATIYLKKDPDFVNVLYDKLSTDDEYKMNFLKDIGIKNIKNIEKNYKIPYQSSSFKNDDISKRQRSFGTLEDCVYYNNSTFVNLMKSNKINRLWNNIIIS